MRLAVAGATGLIGSQVVRLARAAGHDVIGLSRGSGIDLTEPVGLGRRLIGVDAIVDVTRSSSMDRREATEFFTSVATNLGRAARAAGVHRTVVLSIVGIEGSQDFGWYVATLAHERATRQHAPGVKTLRATQFHEFPGQVLARSRHLDRQGESAQIMDMPIQPVDSAEVAALLVEMAGDNDDGDLQLAGPQQENLVDLARRWAALRGDPVRIEAVPAPASIAGGSVLPGPGALIRGVDWQSWAERTSAVDGPA